MRVFSVHTGTIVGGVGSVAKQTKKMLKAALYIMPVRGRTNVKLY